eukprot:TRINITY_DN493_c0_g1_i11.p2 TRINITY_DN493_c0_g1~~TRINITY_DN493_c0_g1_i11.p2  ORF type:complete len:343 (-),score=51.04 TRINITY_DN493_c0_g1_i11:1277-2305(-)
MDTEPFVHVLVVKSGDLPEYQRFWGHTGQHILLQLPESLTKRIGGEVYHAQSGGPGFARLVSQLAAHSLGLPHIHMWDDNVLQCHERRDMGGKPQPIRFNVVMRYQQTLLENVAAGNPAAFRALDFGKNDAQAFLKPLSDNPLRPFVPVSTLRKPAETWTHYVDRKLPIALLGCRRDMFRCKNIDRPFTVSVSTYSAFLLNVAETVPRGILYPPVPRTEDIEFNRLCLEAELSVIKCNRFFHTKLNLTRNVAAVHDSAAALVPWSDSVVPLIRFDPALKSTTHALLRAMTELKRLLPSSAVVLPVAMHSTSIDPEFSLDVKGLSEQLPDLLYCVNDIITRLL